MIHGTYILNNLEPINVWVDFSCDDEIGDQLDAEDYGWTDFNKLKLKKVKKSRCWNTQKG